MKIHIVHGFPDRVDDRWLENLHASTATDKSRAKDSADYYTRFYGGLRDIRILSFKVEDRESNSAAMVR